MARTKPEPKHEEIKPRPVEVGPEDRPILEELKEQHGTFKNVVSKALRAYHKQLHEQPPANVAGGH